jgi:hypothetical protein
MRKTINTIVLAILCFALAGCSNTINIDEAKELIVLRNYQAAGELIKKNNLLSKANDEITEALSVALTRYKITNLAEFSSLAAADWGKAAELNNVISELNIKNQDNRFSYLDQLLKLVEYRKYIPVINWFNSDHKATIDSYLENANDNLAIASTSIAAISFEEFGLDNHLIRELADSLQAIATYYRDLDAAMRGHNQEALNDMRTPGSDILESWQNIIEQINLAETSLKTKISELSTQ